MDNKESSIAVINMMLMKYNLYSLVTEFCCQTAHCGRRKPHVDFGTSAFPTVQSRG